MSMTRKRLFRIVVCGTLGVAVLLFLLNPYTRQSVFGPKIQGEPLCYWQGRFRSAADPDLAEQSVMPKVFAFLGITSQSDETQWLDDANTIVVALSLLDDPRPAVRAGMAQILARYPESPDAIAGMLRLLDDPQPRVRLDAVGWCKRDDTRLAAPVRLRLHELIEDQDLDCRVSAASLLVEIDDARDRKTLKVLLEGLGSRNEIVRVQAAWSLCQLTKDYPECFTDVAAAARRDLYARLGCARAAYVCGPVAVPLLIELLDDGNVCDAAARSLGNMGPTAAPAIPALVRMQSAPGVDTRRCAREALSKIDPERYPQKKGVGEQ